MNIRQVFFALFFAGYFGSGSVFALTSNWTNPNGGLWSDSTNWSNGTPSSGDTVNITLAGTYTVTLNVVATPRRLTLGGSSGTQTLLANQNINLNYTAAVLIVNAHGVLDLQDTLRILQSSATALVNSGIVQLRSNRTILTTSGNILNNGTINLYSRAAIRRSSFTLSRTLSNAGTVEVVGDSASILLQTVFNSGICRLDSSFLLTTHAFVNSGLLDLAYGSELYLERVDTLSEQPLTNDSTGIIQLRGGSVLDGHDANDADNYPPPLNNYGLVDVIADPLLPDRQATILLPTTVFTPLGLARISSGNLRTNPLSIFDSLYIASSCTLATSRLDVNPIGGPGLGTMAGSGTVHFLPGSSNGIGGRVYFTGGFWLSDSASLGSTVTFTPDSLPAVHLRSLNMSGPLTTFSVTSNPDAVVDSILQYAGVVRGTVTPGTSYIWNWGRLGAGSDSVMLIPVGANLAVSGGLTKRLDSLALRIEGSATMQDSGLFLLEYSSVVDVKGTATLYAGPGLTMSGLGAFYNRGVSTFDPQGDSVAVNVHVTNTTLASRTPGTIDIPSGPVTLSGGGDNSGTINVQDGGALFLDGMWENRGTISIAQGGSVTVKDSLINDTSGVIGGGGILDVSQGTFVNNGTLSPGSSPGQLSVSGNVTLGASAVLNMEIGGTGVNDYDRILVTGNLAFDGTLQLTRLPSYIPVAGDIFWLCTYGSWTGQFSSINGTDLGNGWSLEIVYETNGLTAHAVCSPTIAVTSPNGGNVWPIGSAQTITWSSAACFTDNVNILLNRDYPAGTWETLVGNTVNDGSETWTVTGDPTLTARIRIEAAADATLYDESDASFATTLWSNVPSGTIANLYDVDFADPGHGWAVGGLNAAGMMLRTTNAGATWTFSPTGDPVRTRGIDFVGLSNGWMAGTAGHIHASTDGGVSWTLETSGVTANLEKITFLDTNSGWAVGAGGTILRTTDGGATWVTEPSGTTSLLYDVAFADGLHGWVVGESGLILNTTDGGATWSAQTSGTTSHLYAVDFESTTSGWVVGLYGTVLHTTNGGSSWSVQTSGTTAALYDVYFVMPNYGWAVGSGGMIIRTTNGGSTWSREASGTSQILYGVTFLNSGDGWAVGNYGTVLHCVQNLPPAVPEHLVVRRAASDAVLHWNPVAGNGIQYQVFKDSSPNGQFTNLIGTVSDTTFVDPGAITLPPSQQFYRVRAVRP